MEGWRRIFRPWYLPADSGALDPNGDFAVFEILSLLDALERRSRLGYPKLMLRVCEDTDIGQADRVGHGSHAGFVLRTEKAAGGRGTRRRRGGGGGQACVTCFLFCEHGGGG